MIFGNRIQTPPVTKNLIITNVIIYIACMLNESFMTQTFALFYPASRFFHFWQPVTHMFLHGNLMHLFFNMYALWFFGTMMENTIGSKKFAILYFVSGLGAAALHLGVEALQAASFMNDMADGVQSAAQIYAILKSTPTVGASGAVYGLLISYAMLFPNTRLTLIFPPITMRTRTWALIFIGVELLTGILGTADGIAHFAHLGGVLFGWLLISYWRKKGTLFDRY